MMDQTLLDFLPLWGLCIVILAGTLTTTELGYRLGRKSEAEKEGPTGTVVGATLGLLAFLLAFTFGMAANRFDTRREVFQKEVNAIGTAYLRTSFLPHENAENARHRFRTYVDHRLKIQTDDAILMELIRDCEKLHEQLWADAVAVGRQSPDSEMTALYVAALNDVIDLHSDRVTAGLRGRIPLTIWGALYVWHREVFGWTCYGALLCHHHDADCRPRPPSRRLAEGESSGDDRPAAVDECQSTLNSATLGTNSAFYSAQFNALPRDH